MAVLATDRPATQAAVSGSWLRWPLPALLAWALAWSLYILALRAGLGPLPALAAATALGLLLAFSRRFTESRRWRRLMVALGFPLSIVLSAPALSLPAWAWLLPLAVLVLAYPQRSWGDAPLFPTPAGALRPLADIAPLPPGARLLDAGCGLGHGLRELRRAYPQARIEGIEWSVLLARLAALRCPWAEVRRGDMWAQPWQGYALVYLFQRPESMVMALAKARAELASGAWLASLDFELPELRAVASFEVGQRHRLWLYRMK